MSDLTDRLRRIGNAGSTEARVALEAVREIERLEAALAEVNGHRAFWPTSAGRTESQGAL